MLWLVGVNINYCILCLKKAVCVLLNDSSGPNYNMFKKTAALLNVP